MSALRHRQPHETQTSERDTDNPRSRVTFGNVPSDAERRVRHSDIHMYNGARADHGKSLCLQRF